LGPGTELLRQLHWRDYFTQVAFYSPHVFGRAFKPKYNLLTWSGSTTHFAAWCAGRTGFPIVDAGMRELVATGFMHNRVRMIVSSFLVKDLHIDWRRGEQFFARNLVDYDPSVNNGNWQWAASTGCDAQPYFRIFNPWLQQQKYDPDCTYVKRWVPELRAVPPTTIHALPKKGPVGGYPSPIVDHAAESAAAKTRYRSLSE
jgi:deoxyribodipyrimidine photo-lyase